MTFPLPPPMRRALELAREAAEAGEVPVGAVVTLGDAIDRRSAQRDARIERPDRPCRDHGDPGRRRALGTPRLDECTLWVSLEPCAMCAAAVSLARIKALRFAAEDPKGGGVIHGARIFAQPTCHHRPDVLVGIGEAEAARYASRLLRRARR